MPEEKRDIANDPMYAITTRIILKDQHAYLLSAVTDFLKQRESPKSLLVLGPGSEVLPFSDHLDGLVAALGNGNMALVDYNPKIRKDVKAYLTKRGFFDKGKFTLEDVADSDELDLRTIGEKKLVIRQGDVGNRLQFADNSVSIIDANLCIHHATPREYDLEKVLSEIYRVLEHGGLFHYGTGNVDMKYSEKKIDKILKDAREFFGYGVEFHDRRDEANASQSQVYSDVNAIDAESETKQYTLVDINNQGTVRIRIEHNKAEEFLEFLNKQGYKQVTYLNGNVFLPLIDPEIQEDRMSHIGSVNKFYDAIALRALFGFSDRPGIVNGILSASGAERNNALRGVVEYYTGRDTVLKILDKVGFKQIQVKIHPTEPFYNITAYKEVSNE